MIPCDELHTLKIFDPTKSLVTKSFENNQFLSSIRLSLLLELAIQHLILKSINYSYISGSVFILVFTKLKHMSEKKRPLRARICTSLTDFNTYFTCFRRRNFCFFRLENILKCLWDNFVTKKLFPDPQSPPDFSSRLAGFRGWEWPRWTSQVNRTQVL